MNLMQLNLKNVIDKLPTTMKANINPTRASYRVSDAASDYPGLGDVKRFEKFPSVVNQDFISMYREGLDDFLVPYIQQGEMTVSGANRFIEGLVEQIFGNENHYGIFSYLKERNYEGSPERELVRTAERLINSGWRVMKDGKTNRYKIINTEKETVIDATGRSEFFDESSSAVMDESAAHLFIDGDNASKIESLARAVSMDADDLAELGSLDSLLYHTDDKMLSGQILNYKKLRGILSKKASYPVLSNKISFTNLHSEGFTLSDKKVFSHDNVVVMRKDKDEFIVRGILPELNQQFGFNKDMMSVVAVDIKKKLLSNIDGVIVQNIEEISDLGRVIALMHEFWSDEKFFMSRFDAVDSLSRIESFVASGEITQSFYRKLFTNFAVAVVTEAVLLGNNWVSLSSLAFDSASGKVYLYGNSDAFTIKMNDFNVFYDAYDYHGVPGRSFKPFLGDIYPFRLTSENLPILIEALPKEFFTSLAALNTNIEGYPFKFSQVSEYLSKSRDFLMSRAR